MHGSLLPKYRGRVPINWAIIHGETETGATLHYMTEKPDSGDIVAQAAVPILPDDTAKDVFEKVTLAAASCLDRVLPALIAGTAPRMPQDLSTRQLFRRTQGRGWHHRLVEGRAVDPQSGSRSCAALSGSTHHGRRATGANPAHACAGRDQRSTSPALAVENGAIVAHAAAAERWPCCNWKSMVQRSTADEVVRRFGPSPLRLG